MSLYPGARQRPIPPGANDPKIIPIGVILHTDAGDSKSLYGYFNGPSGGIESHFHIPKVYQVEQYRDTNWEADANYHGNSFRGADGKLYGYISVETQGLASDSWNDHQIGEIKKLLLWAHEEHGIPLQRCKTAFSPGVGYHVMFGAPGPWTPVAKSCPGPHRVNQFNNTLLPWMEDGAHTDSGVYDMQFTDPIPNVKDADGSAVTVGEALMRGNYGYRSVTEGGPLENRVSTLEGRVDSNTDAHADYAYDAVTEGGTVDQRLDGLRDAVAAISLPAPDATTKARLEALEGFVTKLKEALG